MRGDVSDGFWERPNLNFRLSEVLESQLACCKFATHLLNPNVRVIRTDTYKVEPTKGGGTATLEPQRFNLFISGPDVFERQITCLEFTPQTIEPDLTVYRISIKNVEPLQCPGIIAIRFKDLVLPGVNNTASRQYTQLSLPVSVTSCSHNLLLHNRPKKK